MHVHRHVPAEGFIKAVVLRRTGEVLLSAHHVGDLHQVVIHHVGKVIGGEAVGLDEDHVVQLGVVHGDVAVDLVVEGGRPLLRIVLPDHEGLSRGKVRLDFLFGKAKAVLVIGHDHLAVDFSLQGIQSLLVAEAVVCFAFLHQLFRVLHVNAGLHALRLDVGTVPFVLVRTLVVDQTCLLKGAVDDLRGAFHKASLVRVLDAEDKGAVIALMLRDEVSVERGP